MSDYDLYYWSVPFRGQFVRAVLTFAGKTRTEADDASISQLMSEPVKRMPVPFMGPKPLATPATADEAVKVGYRRARSVLYLTIYSFAYNAGG